jgi:hypothetical protein
MKFLTTTLLTIIYTLCLVPLFSHKTMGQGFSVSPSRLSFTGNPGETVAQTITLSNTSQSPLNFSTRMQDFDRDSLGNKTYYDAGSRPTSNARWISMSATSLKLLPGESKKINISMAIPVSAKSITNSMIFFTQVKDQVPSGTAVRSIGVSLLMEMGVQVYYTPNGLNAGELEFLAFEDRGTQVSGKEQYRKLMLKVHNKGDVNKDAFVRLELTNKDTGEEHKIDPASIAMLPNTSQWVTFTLPMKLSGKFLAVAILDAGAAYDLKIAEKEITYRP